VRTQIRRLPAIGAGVMAMTIVLAGCGSSGSPSTGSSGGQTPASGSTTNASAATKSKRPKPHVPRIEKVEVSSSAVNAAGELASRYTCDGSDTSLPLHVTGIPHSTAEVMLDVLNLEPVEGKLFFSWAVAGLSPNVRDIAAGKLPAGAVVGVNTAGQARYSVCPPKGKNEAYVVVVFALPHKLGAQTGFNATELRLQAVRSATYEGFLKFTYKRQ
jgi:phosphatidylethanolamine-binding protein (PEBP) family uncharacterized protein